MYKANIFENLKTHILMLRFYLNVSKAFISNELYVGNTREGEQSQQTFLNTLR